MTMWYEDLVGFSKAFPRLTLGPIVLAALPGHASSVVRLEKGQKGRETYSGANVLCPADWIFSVLKTAYLRLLG